MADVSKIQLPSGSTVNIKDDRFYIVVVDSSTGLPNDTPNNIYSALLDDKAMFLNIEGSILPALISYTWSNQFETLTAFSISADSVSGGEYVSDVYEYDFNENEWTWSGSVDTLIMSSSTPINGDILTYNNGSWVAQPLPIYDGTVTSS